MNKTFSTCAQCASHLPNGELKVRAPSA